MKKIKKALRMVLSFILMFGVIACIFSVFIRFVLLNENFIADTLEDGDYYTQLTENLNTKYETLSLESSIPKEVFMSAVLEDYDIQKLTRENVDLMVNYVTSQTDESAVIIDKTIFEEPVHTYVKEYAKEKEIPFDEELQLRTATIVNSATQITENRVTLFNLGNVVAIPQFQLARKMITLAYNSLTPVLIALTVIIALLALLYSRKRYRILFWIGSSISAGSIFIIVPSTLSLLLKLPQRIQLSAPYVNTAIQSLALGYSRYFLTAGLLALALGVVCISLYYYISSKSLKEKSSNRMQHTQNTFS